MKAWWAHVHCPMPSDQNTSLEKVVGSGHRGHEGDPDDDPDDLNDTLGNELRRAFRRTCSDRNGAGRRYIECFRRRGAHLPLPPHTSTHRSPCVHGTTRPHAQRRRTVPMPWLRVAQQPGCRTSALSNEGHSSVMPASTPRSRAGSRRPRPPDPDNTVRCAGARRVACGVGITTMTRVPVVLRGQT